MAEVRRQARLVERSNFEVRRKAARAAAERGIDWAAALAEMLVPNVRPVRLERSDCGPVNEIDLASGEETYADWLVGTPFAGAEADFWDILQPHEADMIGHACNAEFRSGFAAYLRRRLASRALRDAYLALAPYWPGTEGPEVTRSRLTAFAGTMRGPPLRWAIYGEEQRRVTRWLTVNASGRALRGAVDDFWRENGPRLASNAQICPAAAERWPVARADILRQIAARMAQSGVPAAPPEPR